MMKKRLVLLIVLFSLAACGDKIILEHPEFIGFWEGADDKKVYSLRVEEDGSGTFAFVGDGKMRSFRGIIRINGNRMRVGTRTLEIITFPIMQDGFFITNLDGIAFRRVD